jgi:glutaredoxin
MITFYSTGCKNCLALERILKSKNIQFEKNTDIEEMKKLNLQSAPYLSIDGKLLDFVDSINWVRGQA